MGINSREFVPKTDGFVLEKKSLDRTWARKVLLGREPPDLGINSMELLPKNGGVYSKSVSWPHLGVVINLGRNPPDSGINSMEFVPKTGGLVLEVGSLGRLWARNVA